MADSPNIRRKKLLDNRSFAFLIGINDYPEIGQLQSPVNDVNELAQIFKDQQGFDHVGKLLNPKAEQISQFLAWLDPESEQQLPTTLTWIQPAKEQASNEVPTSTTSPQKITEEDFVVFYFAGHGISREISDKPDHPPVGFLMASDATSTENSIKMQTVFEAFHRTNCKQLLMILDCCFAGSIRFISSTRSPSIKIRPFFKARFHHFLKRKSRQVLVSAGPHQKAADQSPIINFGDRNQMDITQNGLKHSPFALALMRALNGQAELPSSAGKKDGIITPHELIIYLKREVILSTELTLDQTPEYFPIRGHQGGDFIFLDPNNPSNFTDWKPINPYKGLFPFEPEDQVYFCGREKEVKRLLEKLSRLKEDNAQSVLFITGPSGQGKSSLVKAGLFPALQQKMKTDGKTLFLFYARPGIDNTWLEYQREVKEEEQRYLPIDDLKVRIKRLVNQQHALLLIDQFEEVFNNLEKAEIQKKLNQINLLLANKNLTLIITLRSDSEWRIKPKQLVQATEREAETAPPFSLSAFWKEEHIYRLPYMSLSQLRASIQQPAHLNWFEFEGQLIDTILAEVEGTPGALPLLSFVMQSLYQEEIGSANRKLQLTTYRDKLKGIQGALSNKANEVYQHLEQEENGAALTQTFKKIFLRMVCLNDGGYARRRVFYHDHFFNKQKMATGAETEEPLPPHELDYLDDEQDKWVQQVIRLLVKNHLIVQGTDVWKRSYIEPVHDTLIQHWDLGKLWIDEFSKNNLLLQRTLWTAVNKWLTLMANQRERWHLFLWDNHPMIEQLKAILDQDQHWFNQAETDFIRKSWKQRIDTIEQRKRNLDSANALALAAEARRIANTDPTVGLNFAYNAYLRFPNEQSCSALKDISSNLNHYFYTQFDYKAICVLETSDQHSFLLAGSRTGKVRLIHLETKKEIALPGKRKAITALTLSPNWEIDGDRYLAIGTKDTVVEIWNFDQPIEMPKAIHQHKGAITQLKFSPDGNHLLSGAADGTVIVWDLKGNQTSFNETVPATQIPEKLKSKNATDILDFKFDEEALLIINRELGLFKIVDDSEPVVISPALNSIVNGVSNNAVAFLPPDFHTVESPFNPAEAVAPIVEKSILISVNIEEINFWEEEGNRLRIRLSEAISGFKTIVIDPFQKRHPNFKIEDISICLAFDHSNKGVFYLSFDQHIFAFNAKGHLLKHITDVPRIQALAFYGPSQSLISFSTLLRFRQMHKAPIASFTIGNWGNGQKPNHLITPTWRKGRHHFVMEMPNREIQLWNIGMERAKIIRKAQPDQSHEFSELSFSPTGHFIISQGKTQGEVYDLSGTLIKQYEGRAKCSADGRILNVKNKNEENAFDLPLDQKEAGQFKPSTIDPFQNKFKVSLDNNRHTTILHLTDQTDNQLYRLNYGREFTSRRPMVMLSPDHYHILVIDLLENPENEEMSFLKVFLYENPIGLLENGAIERMPEKIEKETQPL